MSFQHLCCFLGLKKHTHNKDKNCLLGRMRMSNASIFLATFSFHFILRFLQNSGGCLWVFNTAGDDLNLNNNKKSLCLLVFYFISWWKHFIHALGFVTQSWGLLSLEGLRLYLGVPWRLHYFSQAEGENAFSEGRIVVLFERILFKVGHALSLSHTHTQAIS